MTPEEKMRYENLMDPVVHARNHMVLQLVMQAMRIQRDARRGDNTESVAQETSEEIIKLFY